MNMETMIKQLRLRYSPVALVLYGSYADGTQSAESDFDVLLITKDGIIQHDNESTICGVSLDAFIYPEQAIRSLENPLDLIQLCHSKILLDTPDHLARSLVDRVRAYADSHAVRSAKEKAEYRAWAQKMLKRSRRGDAEGLFRAHWLLIDSLEFYCIVRDQFYFGPKKTLIALTRDDQQGYALYEGALRDLSQIEAWIEYVFSPMQPVPEHDDVPE